MTGIEWTEAVWNPTTGCDRVSPGCDHCYALTMAKRLKGMGQAKYQADGDPRTSGPGFGIAMHPDALTLPLGWRKPRRIFVNSMSDLFHDGVSDDFIVDVFAVMASAKRHTFQLLTKRHGRLRSLLNQPDFRSRVVQRVWSMNVYAASPEWPLPNVWLGVSVENQKWADIRIPALLQTPAAVRWLSMEPLLGPVDLWNCGGVSAIARDWTGGPGGGSGAPHPLVDWVVVGGESGPGARPMHPDWPRQIRDVCVDEGVPFFFKQHGDFTSEVPDGWPAPTGWVCTDGRLADEDTAIADGGSWAAVYRLGKKAAGRRLDGELHDAYPAAVA